MKMKLTKRTYKCIVIALMLFLVLLSAASCTEDYNRGQTVHVPYPTEYGVPVRNKELHATSIDVVLDVPEFVDEQDVDTGEKDFLLNYDAVATVTTVYQNVTDRDVEMTFTWDMGSPPSYLYDMSEENREIYTDKNKVLVNGEQVELTLTRADYLYEYTFKVAAKAGESVTVTSICPIYPTIMDEYDPIVYEYTLSLSVQAEESTPIPVSMRVNTPYKLAKGPWLQSGLLGDLIGDNPFPSSKNFSSDNEGYVLKSQNQSVHDTYYKVHLSTKAHQVNKTEQTYRTLVILLVGVPFVALAFTVLQKLGQILSFVLAATTFIVLAVQRKKGKKHEK